MTDNEPSELEAILEGAYWTFLHLRLARRSAERGKVHGRSFRGFVEMAHELADAEGGTGALLSALDYVHRVRGPVEDEVLAGVPCSTWRTSGQTSSSRSPSSRLPPKSLGCLRNTPSFPFLRQSLGRSFRSPSSHL